MTGAFPLSHSYAVDAATEQNVFTFFVTVGKAAVWVVCWVPLQQAPDVIRRTVRWPPSLPHPPHKRAKAEKQHALGHSLAPFLVTVTSAQQKQLKEGFDLAHSLRVQSVEVTEARRQECEAGARSGPMGR